AAQADGVFRTDIERRGAIAGWIQGKVVQSLALDALLCAPFACDRLLPVARRFNWQDLYTNAGQFQDVSGEGQHLPDPAQCLQIAELKTGRLFKTGIESAAELAGASVSQTEALGTWIHRLAVAYQLRDDLEDLSRSSEKGQGRSVGTDLVTCKPTYIMSLAQAQADPVQRAALIEWVANPSSDPGAIAGMITILRATGAVEKCAAKVKSCVDEGLTALHQASPAFTPEMLTRMEHFTEYFISAEYWERALSPLPDPLFPPERVAGPDEHVPREKRHE
ncbi:MAG: polyprenyl synthetase family protein, partial [Akkermansiaceae bacterium]|nr:polyprenyl synthetase family protein [Armatimonadota bacterium]